MKRAVFHILSVTTLIALLTATSQARQAEAPQPPRARGGAQQAQRDAAKAAKQTQQLPRNLTGDQPSQPNPPNRNEQGQKNRVANAVVDHYLGGFQKGVGLDDEQTQKFSPRLGNYVRQQLMLADRRNQAMNKLKELNDQKASEEEIQAQNKILDQTEAQQINAKRRFYADVEPELSVQQKAKLKVYMDNAEQNVRQAIQKSRND
jgi:type II secretory pathway component PulK